ncbi:MAG: polymer-forming cytoskeletal protein [Treponema sp.]|jgi:cytoskeletal protein CcmA (bactofilin family)|nr:polymer-forming cytoskeletal protein [Treponema sp.]
MASRRGDFSINTIIGPNTSVSGNLEIGGFVRIDGNVRGDVIAQGRVVIGEDARMRSNISGTSVTVGGVVYGNVLASERLTVLSTGLIIGDVITRRIQADEGSLIHGRIRVCPSGENWDRALSEYRDAQGVRSALSSFPEAYDQG